jgi:hypothetical protein
MNDEADNSGIDGADREADARLVHALLLHLHDEQAVENRERRVQQAITAVRDSAAHKSAGAERASQAGSGLRFPAWTQRLLAVAAILLIVIGIWMRTSSSTTAQASVNDIVNALARPGDRTFHIQMEDLPEPPGRNSPIDQPGLPRPGLDDAVLYLRDGHQFVLARHDPKGGLIYDGFDGEKSWRVRKGVIAETKDGPGAGGIPMPPIMADVPFSDLHGTLVRIEVDYTVERNDDAPLPAGGEPIRHILVRRKSRDVRGPETIEIWADPKTAIPRRIVFDQAKVQGNRLPCRISLDLTSEDPLPANWFGAAAHTGTSRPEP